MNMRGLLVALLTILMTGCATLHLYPLGDAGSAARPASSIAMSVAAGEVSFKLPSGEKFSGTVRMVKPGEVRGELVDTWDSIYGKGHYVAHVLGSPLHATAVVVGDKGTTVQIEWYMETAETPLQGIARDSAGNIYKVAI